MKPMTRLQALVPWRTLTLADNLRVQRLADSVRQLVLNLVSLAVFTLLWQVMTAIVRSKYLPTPLDTLKAAAELFANGDLEGYTLWRHMYVSLYRVFAGFGAAAVMGVLLGLLMGLYPAIYLGTRSIVEPFRFIPPIAWVPMAIVMLSGFWRYVFIIWLGAFFPIFINTLMAVPKVDPDLKDMVKSLGGTRWDVIRKIIIPSVLPDILAGMRIGMGASWMCIVAAEMIGGESVGLGRMILKYAELLRTNEILVGIVLIGIIGFLINEVFILIDKWLFRWRRAVTL